MSLFSGIGINQTCRQVMSVALRQSQQVLQMSQLELTSWVSKEIENNPLLERKMPLTKGNSRDLRQVQDFLVAPELSLREIVLAQARERFSFTDLKIAVDLINHFDERGWLTDYPESELLDKKQSEILTIIQNFNPPGVGARNLQEFLLLKLKEFDVSIEAVLVKDHFELLLRGHLAEIQKKLHISRCELQAAIKRLIYLSSSVEGIAKNFVVSPLVADFIIEEMEDTWAVKLEESAMPCFSIRADYIELYSKLKSSPAKQTMHTWIEGAKWLSRCLSRRKAILRKIGEILIETQQPFLLQIGDIVPIKLQKLAQLLQVHETTAWRAVRQKTVACPQGLVSLQKFFSTHEKKEPTRRLLRRLIEQENKNRPLTDQELCLQLEKRGIRCARRTVNKYRHALKIRKVSLRKDPYGS